MADEIVQPDQQPELSVQKKCRTILIALLKLTNRDKNNGLIGWSWNFCDQRSKLLNFDFDHMFGLVNGFCDQKSERSELNRQNKILGLESILITPIETIESWNLYCNCYLI